MLIAKEDYSLCNRRFAMIKVRFLSLLFLSFLFGATLYSDAPGNPFAGGPGAGGLLPMPSKEEMEEIEKFLSTLSESELQELAQIGEEIIKTAEQEGVPVFGPPPSQPSPQPIPQTKEAPKETSQPEKSVSENEKKGFKKILDSLIKTIDSIRQKSTGEEELNDKLSPFDKQLNTLLYYLHVVNDEKIIKHIMGKDFDTLRSSVKTLSTKLSQKDKEFIVPEFPLIKGKKSSVEKKTYREKIKKAEKVLEDIIDIFEKSFQQNKLIDELEKVIKKYEPEALKVKKEQEEKEKQAQDYVKRIPTTNTGASKGYSPSYGDYNSASYGPHYSSPYAGANSGAQQPITPSTSSRSQPRNYTSTTSNRSSSGSTGQKKASSSQKGLSSTTSDSTTISTTLSPLESLEKSVMDHLSTAEKFLQQHFPAIDRFVDNYTNDSNEGALAQPLKQLNFHLNDAKKQIGKWEKQLKKDTGSDFAAFEKKKQNMKKKFSDSTALTKIKSLRSKTKPQRGLKDSIKGFDSAMDYIEDKMD